MRATVLQHCWREWAEYAGPGKGKPLGISCFYSTLHLLCLNPVRYEEPFACQGQTVLRLAGGWLLGGSMWAQWSGTFPFYLLPWQRAGPLHLLSSSTYPGFSCEALSNLYFCCIINMFGLGCFIFVSLKTLFWGSDQPELFYILHLAWSYSAVRAICALQLFFQTQWASLVRLKDRIFRLEIMQS